MARVFSLMTCVMLFLAVEHSVQALKRKRTSEGCLEPVVAQLVAEQTRIQNLIDVSTASMASMKADLQKTTTDLKKTTLDIQKTTTDFQKTTLDLQKTKLKLQKTQKKLEAAKNIGSTFVRWGRKTCPAKTTLVYSGVAGGKEWNQAGSGTNRLCLTRAPQFDNTSLPTSAHYGYLYGAEYQHIGNHHDHDVPCSVCRAPQFTTIMMAATLTCPPGWTAQYIGLLISSKDNEYATEYVCMDRNPENAIKGRRNENGLLFYPVMTVCGSLPCPPYNASFVTCVVCSRNVLWPKCTIA